VRRPGPLVVVLALAFVAAACGSDAGGPAGASGAAASSGAGGQVQAIVASVDLYTGAPQRVAVGLVTNDNELVSFGTVGFAFEFIGTASSPSEPQPGPSARASFVPTYGMHATGDAPTITQPSEMRGVYEAQNVTFDRAGYWTLTVTADVGGLGPQTARATLGVNERPEIPAPGQPALRTENLTLDSTDAPQGAIDSRFTTGGEIPDPELHGWTIARAFREGRPALVVFSTPVFCESRFCGPVTNMVQHLSHRYADRAEYIHVEIWKDFQNQVINQAAADWLYRNGDLTEPWLFLIGADGTILDRWSAMWSEQEVAAELAALPPMKG
jgi:hypothetical protein